MTRVTQYLRQVSDAGAEAWANLQPDSQDVACAYWVQENPEQFAAILRRRIDNPAFAQRLAAAVAVYYHSTIPGHDQIVPLRRIGGLIAGGVFDEILAEVHEIWETRVILSNDTPSP
jgi:hypothetical protein